MKILSSTTLVLSLVGSTIETVKAYPNGAGACQTNGVSVGGSHLTTTPVVNASLAEAGFEVVINVGNGESILTGVMPVGLTAGGLYTFTVRSTGDTTFKGALMRFSEDVGDLSPAEWEINAKAAFDVCGPYPSLTHSNPTEKTNFTGMMSFDKAGPVNLLIDLVLYNTFGTGSSYAFTSYPLTLTESTGPAMNVTTTPPPMVNETTTAPATMTPSLAPGVVNMTMPPAMNETIVGGGGKAPKTDEPMGSNATGAPTIMPMTGNVSIAPSMVPETGAPIPAKLPTAAPAAKVAAGPMSSAAAHVAAMATTTTTTLVMFMVVATMMMW